MAKPTLDEAIVMMKAENANGITTAIAKYEALKLACEELKVALNNPAFLGMIPKELAPIESSFQHIAPLILSIDQARHMMGLTQNPQAENPFTDFAVPPEAGGAA